MIDNVFHYGALYLHAVAKPEFTAGLKKYGNGLIEGSDQGAGPGR